jgi:prophage antirepressor-like protein
MKEEQRNKIKLFENQRIRVVWGEIEEEWYFSVVDVVSILTESVDGRKYWNKLKQRLKEEGNETVTNCHQLKLLAPDGKMRLTDVANTQQLFRAPSPERVYSNSVGQRPMMHEWSSNQALKGRKQQDGATPYYK